MSTVKITYSGPVALVVADEDYTEEDWDEAASELALRGFAPLRDEAHQILPDDSELHVWCRQPQAQPARSFGPDIVIGDTFIEVKRQRQ